MYWIIERKSDLAKGAKAALAGASVMPLAYPGDSDGHLWRVTVTNNGEPVDLTGASVTGYFYRQVDGNTPVVHETVASGNVASVLIPQAAYAYEGYVTGVMRIALGDEIMTIDAINFNVGANLTGSIIDPGEVVDIDAVLAMITQMETATSAANAAAEAASAAASSSVRYDTAQTLTDAQKEQARENIDAASVGEVSDLESAVNTIDDFNDIEVGVLHNIASSLNNGATVSGNVLTIPANSTGNNSYISFRVNSPRSLGMLKGKSTLFELSFSVSESLAPYLDAIVSTGTGVTTTVKEFDAILGKVVVLVDWAADATSNYIVIGVRKASGQAQETTTTIQVDSLSVRYALMSQALDAEFGEVIGFLGNGIPAPLNYDSMVSSLRNGATISQDQATLTIPAGSTGNGSYFGARFLASINVLRGKKFHVIVKFSLSDSSFLINANPSIVGTGITIYSTSIDVGNGTINVYGEMASDATATIIVFTIGVSNNTTVSNNVVISITDVKTFYYIEKSADLICFDQPENGGKLSVLGHSMVQQARWQNSFLAQTRMTSYENVAIYGGILAQHYTDVSNIATDSDVVVVWYDTNDWANNITLGTVTDSTTSPTTFCGALKYVCKWLSENIPSANVILVSSPKRFDNQFSALDDKGYQVNANGNTLEDFSDAIKNVAELYSYTFCDLFHTSGINSGNYLSYLDNDGLHPNYYGAWRIAQLLAKAAL